MEQVNIALDNRRTGRRVLMIVFAFFVTFMIVDAVFVTLAIRTNPGVVTEHAYEQGLAYNKVLHWNRDQKEMGYNGDVRWDNGRLSVNLRDVQGRFVPGLTLNAIFIRALADHPDVQVLLHEEKGAYIVDISSLARGAWRVQIVAETPKGKFYMTRDILQK